MTIGDMWRAFRERRSGRRETGSGKVVIVCDRCWHYTVEQIAKASDDDVLHVYGCKHCNNSTPEPQP